MGFFLGWNNPLILTIDPNFQQDIQVGAHFCGESLDSSGKGIDWTWPSDGRGQNGILGIRKPKGGALHS